MTTLTRKFRFFAGGHTIDTPADMKYALVLSRESMWFAFLIAALNDLDVLSAEVQNEYLNAPPREKAWFKAGPEFGQYKGLSIVWNGLIGQQMVEQMI